MSATIATVAGTTGPLGSARGVVRLPVAGTYWAFAYLGTTTLGAWSSPDGVTWTAQTTFAMASAHQSEGRNLNVIAVNSGGDVVEVLWIDQPSIVANIRVVRGTVAGGAITYHTLATQVHAIGVLTAPAYSGGGFEYDSSTRPMILNGVLDLSQDTWSVRATADPGTPEQATPPSWGTIKLVDSSQAKEVKSGWLGSTGAGAMIAIADNATGDATLTGLSFYTWNGSAWSGSAGNTAVTGAITAIDKNDWGAVLVSTTDVHAVYRSAAGTLVHRRWNGTSWAAGQSIPAQATASGTGVALASDGTSVWLVVIASDAANSVRYLKWTAGAWDLAWSVMEASTATRTFVSVCKDASGGLLVATWHEGTSLVAGVANVAPPPPAVTGRGRWWRRAGRLL